MAYRITVTCGPDVGLAYEMETSGCLIGRSDTSQFRLNDETISWEHATLAESDRRLFVENLAATGTAVNGKRITKRTKLAHNDEVELSPSCKLRVEYQYTKGESPVRRLMIVGGFLLITAVALAIMASVWWPAPATGRAAASPEQWRQAYDTLDMAAAGWVDRGLLTPLVLEMYRDAWRLQQSNAYEQAAARWGEVWFMLASLEAPGATGQSFAERASTDARALSYVMGRRSRSQLGYTQTPTDDQINADALYWFVRNRQISTSEKAGRRL